MSPVSEIPVAYLTHSHLVSLCVRQDQPGGPAESHSLIMFLSHQDQPGGPAEEAGGAGAGRAAAEASGSFPHAEAEGGRAQGRRLREDL